MATHVVISDASAFVAERFDYLVIGGGTAGLTIAARLAEDADVVVGVLEAGHDRRGDPRIDVPGHFGSLVGDVEVDWKFETTPQTGLGGRVLSWPRGRVLGGTSALNFLVWNRGAAEDYDEWAELGNPGWAWKDLLPYFLNSETLELPTESHQAAYNSAADPRFHGTSGPIQTSFSPWYAATHPLWHASAEKLGIAKYHSALNGSNIGAWTVIQSVDAHTAKRSYAASAHVRDRPGDGSVTTHSTTTSSGQTTKSNLIILTGALVHRIALAPTKADEDSTLRATGVEFSTGTGTGKDDAIFRADARLEVILSAGTVQSPQILELSGIGDDGILKQAGIQTQYHNPNVGRNLQDHIMTSLVYEANAGIQTPEDLAHDPAYKVAAETLYADKKDGTFRSSPSSMAYMPLSHFMSQDQLAGFQQRVSSAIGLTEKDSIFSAQHDITLRQLTSKSIGHIEFVLHHGNSSGFFLSKPGKRYITLHPIHQYPFSRGEIHIKSSSVQDKPRIEPNYYSQLHPGSTGLSPEISADFSPDLQELIAGVKFATQISKLQPLRSLVARRVFPPEDGEPGAPQSDSDWAQFVTDTATTDWHPVGTCSMLPEDKGGVVDPQLRVYGVVGLRVVDASIIPLHIGSHLQATVYAIAEKAADLIKEDRKEGVLKQ